MAYEFFTPEFPYIETSLSKIPENKYITYKNDKGKGHVVLVVDLKSVDEFSSVETFKNIMGRLANDDAIANKITILFIHKTEEQALSKYIQRIKPDSVVLCGNQFTNLHAQSVKKHNLYDNSIFLLGRLVNYKFGKHLCPGVFAPSWKMTTQLKVGKKGNNDSNLLGFVYRAIDLAIEGKNRYTVPDFDLKDINFIDTIEAFDSFMDKLETKKIVAIDTEGNNLNRKFNNQLISIQFYSGKRPVFLPLYHKQTPFLPKELDYIKKRLKKWFEEGNTKYLIFQNAKFDLIQLRRELNLRYISHDVWDISAGEFFLDENRKFLRNVGLYNFKTQTGFYSLFAMALQYGCFSYLTGEISKADRSRMAELDLKAIAEYASKDVIVPFHIAKFQQQEANRRGDTYDGYKKAVLFVGGSMSQVFADMEYNGALVDIKYMQEMLMAGSPFMQQFEKARLEFKKYDAVKKANKIIYKELHPNRDNVVGLFGEFKIPFVFDPDKDRHLQILFMKVLQLRSLAKRKDDKGEKFDKGFLKEYEATIPEVASLGEYRRLKSLKNTYFKGLLKHLLTNPDHQDHRLRANYGFLDILTSRSSAKDPNLQNIPSRGKNAKYIKREFIASPGCINVDVDFNAHEVRGWGNVANDNNIGGAFEPGIKLRREFQLVFNRDPKLQERVIGYLKDNNWKELKNEEKEKVIKKSPFPDVMQMIRDLETRGDIHRMNYEFFFKVPADKVTDEQRGSVKAVLFGTLYDKTAPGLAAELYAKKLNKAYKEAGYDEENPEYLAVRRKCIESAQNIIDVMFKRFHVGKKWIDKTHKQAETEALVVSKLGVVRHLSGHLSHEMGIRAAMNRRGPNSAIQGMSSNLGYFGARQMQRLKFELLKNKVDIGFTNVNYVHDAIKAEASLKALPLTTYYLEHALTSQTFKFVKEKFDWEMPIQLEIAMELGGNSARNQKWDNTLYTMLKIVGEEIDWMKAELKYDLDKDDILKAIKTNYKIIWPYKEKELSSMKGFKGSDMMLLTPEIAGKKDWIL